MTLDLTTLARLITMGRRNLRRNLRRTLITVVGLGVGLALASASWVLIEGYLQASVDAMVGSAGHFQVVHPGQLDDPNLFDVIRDPDAVIAEVDGIRGVVASTPRIQSAVLVSAGDRSAGAMLEGLSPKTEGLVSHRPQQVVAGRFVQGGSEVVLGVDLAKTLRVELGDEVLAVSQAADGSLANALWTVVGLADTRSDTTNQVLAWTTLDEAREFLVLPGVHVVIGVVKTADQVGEVVHEAAALPGFTGVAADLQGQAAPEGEVAANLRPVDPDAEMVVRSWRAINPFMAQMYELGKTWTLVGVALVLITAGLGASNAMSMAVRERTRELGILIAVGMRPLQMIALVLFESVAMFVWASALGLLLGLGLCTWLVRVGLDYSDSSSDWVFAGVAMAPVIRGVWSFEAFWVPVLVLFLVTLAASFLPALRAARLNPVDAMRR